MAGRHIDLLARAERELYPNIPYHQLTKVQREQTYIRAKQLVFEQTGYHIN